MRQRKFGWVNAKLGGKLRKAFTQSRKVAKATQRTPNKPEPSFTTKTRRHEVGQAFLSAFVVKVFGLQPQFFPLCNANEKYARNRMRMRQVAFAPILPVRAAYRVSGQKPADAFLHEEGQMRLGKRQARRQAKKSFSRKAAKSQRQRREPRTSLPCQCSKQARAETKLHHKDTKARSWSSFS
jgi:hypothetical protein